MAAPSVTLPPTTGPSCADIADPALRRAGCAPADRRVRGAAPSRPRGRLVRAAPRRHRALEHRLRLGAHRGRARVQGPRPQDQVPRRLRHPRDLDRVRAGFRRDRAAPHPPRRPRRRRVLGGHAATGLDRRLAPRVLGSDHRRHGGHVRSADRARARLLRQHRLHLRRAVGRHRHPGDTRLPVAVSLRQALRHPDRGDAAAVARQPDLPDGGRQRRQHRPHAVPVRLHRRRRRRGGVPLPDARPDSGAQRRAGREPRRRRARGRSAGPARRSERRGAGHPRPAVQRAGRHAARPRPARLDAVAPHQRRRGPDADHAGGAGAHLRDAGRGHPGRLGRPGGLHGAAARRDRAARRRRDHPRERAALPPAGRERARSDLHVRSRRPPALDQPRRPGGDGLRPRGDRRAVDPRPRHRRDAAALRGAAAGGRRRRRAGPDRDRHHRQERTPRAARSGQPGSRAPTARPAPSRRSGAT